MWHKDVFNYESQVVGRGFIVIFGQHIMTNLKCVVVNVYAACNWHDKVALWEDLTNLKKAHQNLMWSVCGDFNAIRSANERKGVRESDS